MRKLLLTFGLSFYLFEANCLTQSRFLESFNSRSNIYTIQTDNRLLQNIILKIFIEKLQNLSDIADMLHTLKVSDISMNRLSSKTAGQIEQLDNLLKIYNLLTNTSGNSLLSNPSLYEIKIAIDEIVLYLDDILSVANKSEVFEKFTEFEWKELRKNLNNLLNNEEVVNALDEMLVWRNFSEMCLWIKNNLKTLTDTDIGQKYRILNELEKADNLTLQAQIESIPDIILAYNELALQARKEGISMPVILIKSVRILRDNIVDGFFDEYINSAERDITKAYLERLKNLYRKNLNVEYIRRIAEMLSDPKNVKIQSFCNAVNKLNEIIDNLNKSNIQYDEKTANETTSEKSLQFANLRKNNKKTRAS